MIWGVEGRHLWIPTLPQRINLATNPKAGAGDTVGWASSVDILAATDEAPGGTVATTELRMDNNAGLDGDNIRTTVAVVSGHTYRFSAYLYLLDSDGEPGNLPVTQLAVHNAGGTQKAISAQGSSLGTWVRVDVSVTADATGDWTFRVRQTNDGSIICYVTGVLIEESASLGTWFDGDSISGRWLGEPEHSASGWGSRPPTVADVNNPEALMLNRRLDDAGVPVFPRYKVRKISGLSSAGDSADIRDLTIGREGEIPRRSFRRGKTIVYEGLVQAFTRAGLRDAEAALRKAFSNQAGEGLMVVTPHPIYDASGDYRYFNARALGLEIADDVASSPFGVTRGHESQFVVSVRNARTGGFSYYDQDDSGYP